ncbi:hypothetical protein H9Q72_012229 [Fusarium xylarioides]|uniref:Uncharacterized protein n=1 Tax=Fusarium xylarioides TaxID=221167 RepID=A0A9P7L0M9_9HYPO|nr:hypothetical protein H9Q70_009860 [Fusarium xylarioides]KAG5759640.1 hypothetical protein H9Q72_012229 [Fusarium xylarioides]KAG5776513.1 hypothetical protein H9Q73_009811 [Fusarium xylarioides]
MSNRNNDMAQFLGYDQHQDAPPAERLQSVQCVGCGSLKHRLDVCLKAGDDGLMSGRRVTLVRWQQRIEVEAYWPSRADMWEG